MIFPEMDESIDVPGCTTARQGILGKKPEAIMCISSQMVVKRKASKETRVISQTFLLHEDGFDLRYSLKHAPKPVYLNHPHCAKFCVLGGASWFIYGLDVF